MVSEKAKAPQPATGRTVSFVRDAAYSEALGRFVEAFASAEVVMLAFLAQAAHITSPIAKALFSGIHAAVGLGFIKRIWQVEPPPLHLRDELSDLVAQFSAINDMRSTLVHYPSFVTSNKGRVSSNITKALTPKEPHLKEVCVSVDILNDLSADLDKIGDHFTGLLCYPRASLSDRARDFPALTASWRYIRPKEQKEKSHKSARKDRKSRSNNHPRHEASPP